MVGFRFLYYPTISHKVQFTIFLWCTVRETRASTPGCVRQSPNKDEAECCTGRRAGTVSAEGVSVREDLGARVKGVSERRSKTGTTHRSGKVVAGGTKRRRMRGLTRKIGAVVLYIGGEEHGLRQQTTL